MVVFAPDDEVIVDGEAAPIVTPDGAAQFALELVMEIQKTTLASAPGYGTFPAKVADVPVIDDAPVAFALRFVPTVIVAVDEVAA